MHLVLAAALRSARHAALLASLAGVACACGSASQPRSTAASAASATATPQGPLSPAQIAVRATPSIVSIRSVESLGTGFVIRKDGWIATNLHVVAGAEDLIVATPDRHEYPVVEVLAIDEARDLAIVRVEAKDLAPLVLGDSEAVHAGDSVVAIGHPLGLEDTVSNGLVSAVRVLDPSLTVLQISAPIAPGSSGGPLFSDRGEVIGVATAFISQAQNLNFGIPVRYLKELSKDTHPMSLAAFAQATTTHEERLPTVPRAVPTHELKLLSGCSDGDLALAVRVLQAAIDVGAPLYNQGNFAACYHIYEGAALDLERKLPVQCRGPKRALGDGRTRAARLDDPSAQAWALRDAFDGLFDVIERKVAGIKRP
jgi:serine protease Do